MIAVSGLSKRYGDNVVFDALSLSVPAGTTCLAGPSGSGKTTLARILAGLEDADSGTVSGLCGSVVYLFQEPRLLPWANALDNIILAAPDLRARSEAGGEKRSSRSARRAALKAEASGLLAALGLSDADGGKLPAELSGGMRQRVCLARAALHCRALTRAGEKISAVVLDEPLKGLDAATRAAAVDFIKAEFAPVAEHLIIITHSGRDVDDFGGVTVPALLPKS